MLPYSPLHHLLLDAFGGALVATSGNCQRRAGADRTGRGADAAGGHRRRLPASRSADRSTRRRSSAARHRRRRAPLRLGRGTAPLELTLPPPLRVPTLAVGAFLKNTVALGCDDRAVISPHIGDLGSCARPRGVRAGRRRFAAALWRACATPRARCASGHFPIRVGHSAIGARDAAVWHHHAHAAALAGEYARREPLLCFTWDGIGLGPDGTLWGGEALLGTPRRWRRVAGSVLSGCQAGSAPRGHPGAAR